MTLALGTFFQISYVTRSIEAATNALTDRMGATRLTRFDDVRDAEGEPTMIHTLSHFDLGGTEIELIEPRDGFEGSIYLDALTNEAPLHLHHFGYLSPDRGAWSQVVEEAQSQRIPIPFQMELEHIAVAYLDMRSTVGHFVEAVHRSEGTGPGGARLASFDMRAGEES